MLFANNHASVKGKSQHLNPGLSDNIGKAMGPSSQTEVGLGRVRLVHLKATHGSLPRSMLGDDSLPCLLPLPDLQNCPLSPSLGNPLSNCGTMDCANNASLPPGQPPEGIQRP